MPTSEELVQGCLKGKRKYQEMLYQRFEQKVWGICLRYGKSEADAQDMFQESFIKIFEKLASLKDPQALERWVGQVTVRTAINHHNKHAAKQKLTHGLEDQQEVSNQDYGALLDQIENDALVQILNQMPDGYRMVFNLYVVEGYKHKEIAELLGISVNTSRTQLKDAKHYLKAQLSNLGIKKYEVA